VRLGEKRREQHHKPAERLARSGEKEFGRSCKKETTLTSAEEQTFLESKIGTFKTYLEHIEHAMRSGGVEGKRLRGGGRSNGGGNGKRFGRRPQLCCSGFDAGAGGEEGRLE